jgi:hypothetical protein
MNNEMKFSNNEIKQNENREFLKRTEKNAKKLKTSCNFFFFKDDKLADFTGSDEKRTKRAVEML